MAGANYVLDKAWTVLSTYNSSSANGVTKYRCVKAATGGTIDLQATAGGLSYGVVQDAVDATKVATGKAVADVRMAGITKVYCTTATSVVLGGEVEVTTDGGVINASGTAGRYTLGVVVGPIGTTIAAGDLLDVFIMPRKQ